MCFKLLTIISQSINTHSFIHIFVTY